MSREILFRGRSIKAGEWIEGFYCKMDETTYCTAEDYERNPVPTHHYIAYESMTDWGLPNEFRLVEVDPTTVCQYTGLTDRNGVKIFEGDILKLYSDFTVAGTIKYGTYGEGHEGCHMGFFMEWETYKTLRKDLGFWKRELEVCGNIWDNPELLKGGTGE